MQPSLVNSVQVESAAGPNRWHSVPTALRRDREFADRDVGSCQQISPDEGGGYSFPASSSSDVPEKHCGTESRDPGIYNRTLPLIKATHMCSMIFAIAFGALLPAESAAEARPPVITPANLDDLHPLPAIARGTNRIRIAPDGRRIAFVPWKGPTELFGPDLFGRFHQIGNNKTIDFAFSPEPEVVAYSTDGQGTVMLNLRTEKETYFDTGNGYTRVAFSPDGKLLVTGGPESGLNVWDARTGELLRKLKTDTGDILEPVFGTDGRILAVGQRKGRTRLFDPTTGDLLRTFDKPSSRELAFSPDGTTLAIAYADGSVVLWEASSGKRLSEAKTDSKELIAVCWSPDGKLLATAGGSGRVTLWSSRGLKPLKELQAAARKLHAIRFTPDGSQLLVAGHRNLVWEPKQVPGGPPNYMTRAGVEERVWRWGVRTPSVEPAVLKEVAAIRGHISPVNGVSWSPDGKTLATCSSDRTIRLWDPATGRERVTLLGHTNTIPGVSWSPDGKTIASAGGDITVRLWNPATGQERASLGGHTSYPRTVAWKPDGELLASGDTDGFIVLWEGSTGKKVTSLRGHTGVVTSVAWSPDGKTLASTGVDGSLRFWKPATGKPKALFRGHASKVLTLTWRPDGKVIATGSELRTVKLWDVTTGETLATCRGHTDNVNSLAWSPDGNTLASGSDDKTVKLWTVSQRK